MRQLLSLFIAIVLVSACERKTGSGIIVSTNHAVSKFDEMRVSGPFQVEVVSGASHSVNIKADDNLMKYVKVKVVGDQLRISLEKVNVEDANLIAIVTAPAIESIDASAGADIVVRDQLENSRELELGVSSSASIKAKLDAPLVKIDASSGGQLALSGRTKTLKAHGSSGAKIDTGELLSEECTVETSSGAHARVFSSLSLNASASSGSSVLYRGGAATVKKSNSSGGEVNAED